MFAYLNEISKNLHKLEDSFHLHHLQWRPRMQVLPHGCSVWPAQSCSLVTCGSHTRPSFAWLHRMSTKRERQSPSVPERQAVVVFFSETNVATSHFPECRRNGQVLYCCRRLDRRGWFPSWSYACWLHQMWDKDRERTGRRTVLTMDGWMKLSRAPNALHGWHRSFLAHLHWTRSCERQVNENSYCVSILLTPSCSKNQQKDPSPSLSCCQNHSHLFMYISFLP